MNRIDETFAQLRAGNRKGFIPFVTAGDPDLATSREIVLKLAENGADIIELGVPFSDPMADGPTIQRSSLRALANGVSLAEILNMVSQIRKRTDVPIVLFSYLNPLFCYGMERLASDARSAGIDGVLVTDAVDEEAAGIAVPLRKHALDLISLVAPTTTDHRLQQIADCASGFIYAVSRAGVTGVQSETSSAARVLVGRTRGHTDLPVAVGFGISTREQVVDVWQYADAAVVGSAIVAQIERSLPSGNVVERVKEFVNGLLPMVAKDAAEI